MSQNLLSAAVVIGALRVNGIRYEFFVLFIRKCLIFFMVLVQDWISVTDKG